MGGKIDRLPLSGKRVLVTRTRAQSEGMTALLRERGALPIAVPAIEIHPPPDPAPLARALRALATGAYDLVAFTSANAVEQVFAELERQGQDAKAFGKNTKTAAVGTGTAEALALRGITADLVAKDSIGEGLAEEIALQPAAFGTKRILLPRALVAREALPEALREAGWTVEIVAAYETRAPSPEAMKALALELEGDRIDAITFTSSSTVDNLCDALGAAAGALLGHARTFSIGPVTTATATQRGIQVTATANPHTISGLISALEAYFTANTEH